MYNKFIKEHNIAEDAKNRTISMWEKLKKTWVVEEKKRIKDMKHALAIQEEAIKARIMKRKATEILSPSEQELVNCKKVTNWSSTKMTIKALASKIKMNKRIIIDVSIQEAPGKTCVVCLENVYQGDNPCLALGCGHTICFPCASKSEARTDCMVCRAPVTHGIAVYP